MARKKLKTLEDIDNQAMPLRAAEAAAKILKRIDDRLAFIEVSQEWADELIDVLARREHYIDMKRWGITPIRSWSHVSVASKNLYRLRAKETMKVIQKFMESKRKK